MTRATFVVALPLTALALVVSACGGDADESGGAGLSTSAGGSTAAGGGTTTSGTSTSGGGGSGGAVAGCPPDGPFGTAPASVAPDVTLYDCAGGTVQLHGLCSRTAAHLYAFAAWWPTCQAYAGSEAPNQLHAKYADQDFEFWFVVTGTATSAPLDAAYCQTVQQQFGLDMPVLFDPDGVTQSVLDMRTNGGQFVMSRGNVVEFSGGSSHQAVADTLESIFGF